MAEVLLRRSSTLALIPADGLAEEEISHFPMGRTLRCTLVKARSEVNLRHYWASLTALSEATGAADKATLHEWLKLECGLVTPIKLANGELRFVPASIAMEKLSEEDFRAFKKKAWAHIHATFGIDPATLNAEGAVLLGRSSL